MSARVLVIEDDDAIRETVRDELQFEGFTVETVADGSAGLERARSGAFDVVVADWMLPGISGLDLCRVLRAESDVPIILLTARGSEVDRVRGLEVGADDYIVKPFSLAELVSRVRAILRRRELDRAGTRRPSAIAVAGLAIDSSTHSVDVDGQRIRLTPSEFRLLLLFAEHPGQVFSRHQIMEHLWESTYTGDGRAADTHVSTLRRKIEADPASPVRLVTVRGFGYKLDG